MLGIQYERVIDKTIEELERKKEITKVDIKKHPGDEYYIRTLYTILDQLTILNEIKRRAQI